jgi:hypothetical protein
MLTASGNVPGITEGTAFTGVGVDVCVAVGGILVAEGSPSVGACVGKTRVGTLVGGAWGDAKFVGVIVTTVINPPEEGAVADGDAVTSGTAVFPTNGEAVSIPGILFITAGVVGNSTASVGWGSETGGTGLNPNDWSQLAGR